MGELIQSVDATYNTLGKFHVWINTMGGWIPWVDSTYNTMGKFHGWMHTMGGCHFPFGSNGALFHMMGNKYFFSVMEGKDLKIHIEMGQDGIYSMTGIGTITFQREWGSPLKIKDVMFVSSLRKNIISVAMLEYRGYDVIFNKGKELLRHIATWQEKWTRVRVKNMYKL